MAEKHCFEGFCQLIFGKDVMGSLQGVMETGPHNIPQQRARFVPAPGDLSPHFGKKNKTFWEGKAS